MRLDCKRRYSFPFPTQSNCRSLQIPAGPIGRRSFPLGEDWGFGESERAERAQFRGRPIFSAYNPLYSLAGFVVGALVGMTGVGGGSLMTPILVLLFDFHPITAVGTDLLYASVTKTAGTAVHGKQQTVDWHIVGGLALGSVPTSIATLFVMSRLNTLSGDPMVLD